MSLGVQVEVLICDGDLFSGTICVQILKKPHDYLRIRLTDHRETKPSKFSAFLLVGHSDLVPSIGSLKSR